MRLVEAVAAEGHDLPPELLYHATRVSLRHRPLHELRDLLVGQFLVFLADRFPEHVGFRQAEAGEHVGDPHHLLLIGDDAVGRLEHLPECGMGIGHLLLAQLPADEHRVHARIQRAGAKQGVGCDQVVETVALHGAQRVGGQR